MFNHSFRALSIRYQTSQCLNTLSSNQIPSLFGTVGPLFLNCVRDIKWPWSLSYSRAHTKKNIQQIYPTFGVTKRINYAMNYLNICWSFYIISTNTSWDTAHPWTRGQIVWNVGVDRQIYNGLRLKTSAVLAHDFKGENLTPGSRKTWQLRDDLTSTSHRHAIPTINTHTQTFHL